MLKHFFKSLPLLINVIIIAALLGIHFIFKDCNYEMSILFYVFPLPVIITVILFLSKFLSKRYRKINILLALVLLMVWLNKSFKFNNSGDIKETDLEIVFWNTSRNRNFEDAFSVNNHISDVLVLVEFNDEQIREIKEKYPQFYFYTSHKEMAVFSKEKLNIINEKTSKFSTTVIHFETYGINFYAIDVIGSIDVPREWGIDFIESSINTNENTVLLGDFNVPYESLLLDNFKTKFNHTFIERGNGFIETWFWNLPILSLDHIWVSKDLEILKTEKINTWKSDHSMIKTIIRK